RHHDHLWPQPHGRRLRQLPVGVDLGAEVQRPQRRWGQTGQRARPDGLDHRTRQGRRRDGGRHGHDRPLRPLHLPQPRPTPVPATAPLLPYTTLSRSQDITITSGLNPTGVDFGNFQLGSISGQKFNDLNGDGVKQANEPGLMGWTIELDKGADGTVDAMAMTVPSGHYTSPNPAPPPSPPRRRSSPTRRSPDPKTSRSPLASTPRASTSATSSWGRSRGRSSTTSTAMGSNRPTSPA